jgi:hypothetical protein
MLISWDARDARVDALVRVDRSECKSLAISLSEALAEAASKMDWPLIQDLILYEICPLAFNSVLSRASPVSGEEFRILNHLEECKSI